MFELHHIWMWSSSYCIGVGFKYQRFDFFSIGLCIYCSILTQAYTISGQFNNGSMGQSAQFMKPIHDPDAFSCVQIPVGLKLKVCSCNFRLHVRFLLLSTSLCCLITPGFSMDIRCHL